MNKYNTTQFLALTEKFGTAPHKGVPLLSAPIEFGKYTFQEVYEPMVCLKYHTGVLSKHTQANIDKLIANGWTFSKIHITAVIRENNKPAFSYYILGCDEYKEPIMYVRRETQCKQAGQTKIYHLKYCDFATDVLRSFNSKPVLIKVPEIEDLPTGDELYEELYQSLHKIYQCDERNMIDALIFEANKVKKFKTVQEGHRFVAEYVTDLLYNLFDLYLPD